MGLAIILGLARRLTFNSENHSFLVPLHSSFMTFRFGSSALGAAACGWVQGKRMMKAGSLPVLSLSGKEPVGRTSPGCCGITKVLPECSGVVLVRETSTRVTSVIHYADNSSVIGR